ncbi:MAG: PduL/EutD family phosphate acyltransferase, partial [Candidatus Pacearchaeota archaeon]|nr:PduL/EutD family phosphate acyltransferase [Candidatus Pacearchaeota archaeon]
AVVAKRHLHLSTEQAKKLMLKNSQVISMKIPGLRGLIFNNVVVRVGPGDFLAFQLDTDEANAAGISPGMFGEIIR